MMNPSQLSEKFDSVTLFSKAQLSAIKSIQIAPSSFNTTAYELENWKLIHFSRSPVQDDQHQK
jgi:hypothetical protein